ncbi:MAG: efflux RND transporter permease subunit, partial [Acidobacteria bacterium]
MSALPKLLHRRRLIVATALLLAVAGVASWHTMPREEDPRFPSRNGLLVVRFPGADPETVERLILEPLEEHLAEVAPLAEVYATARNGVAVVHLDLADEIYDTAAAWDEVEDAIAAAEADFPAGAVADPLDDEVSLEEAIVLALTGSADPLALTAAAERLKRSLLALDGVRKVKLIGDPGEQITIEYDDATARRLGIDPRLLGLQLAGRSRILPGGLIHLGRRTANLQPLTDFRSLEEIAATPVLLPSGAAVPLDQLARVRRGPREPARERMRVDGELAVGLGIVPSNGLDRIAFGRQVRRLIAQQAPALAPLQVVEVAFQPDQVERRLRGLSRSLLYAIAIVAAVLFVAMGPRLGLVVVLVVPLVTFASLALYAFGGGILHQISIAALVIALGMLVDNAIVVAEGIQYRLDRGEPPRQAAVKTVEELALPLATATGTTLAAFVPMLLSKGPTGDFTRSLPVLIMLTLSVSYLFAVLVTPVLGELLLRPRGDAAEGRLTRWLAPLAGLAVRRAGRVLAGALLLVVAAAAGSTLIKRQFFPTGDRAMVVVDLEMPEGTHLEATSEAARRFEEALAAHPDSGRITTFIGRSTPRFYYNLSPIPASPHLAQMMVETSSSAATYRLVEHVRQLGHDLLPEAVVVARRLEQGPPIEAPIEVRLWGEELAQLETAADAVLAEMRTVAGTRDVRHNLGLGVPSVRFAVDDAAAARFGLSRADVGLALLGRTLGAEVGQFRMSEDPVPILVRSRDGERFPAADLPAVDVATPGGRPVPLSQVARLEVAWQPAAIYHRDGRREVRVMAQLARGTTFSEVLDALRPRLAAVALPPGVELAYAGEAAESGKANAAILRALPLGTILLLFFLLVEFNSFRRVAIVLVTVPLAATGVVPGLLLSGQPFGFMSLLGIFSLVGIVVNNAIVLLDRVESQRAAGVPLEQALIDAVRRRTRPILLTMATTVAGLLPLALSPAPLWPPMAWSMISGLAASTLLTLLVVPALYKMLFCHGTGDWIRGRTAHQTACGVLLVALALPQAVPAAAPPAGEDEPAAATAGDAAGTAATGGAITLTLEEAMARARQRPRAQA